MKRIFVCAAATQDSLTILQQKQNALIPAEFRQANDTLLPVMVKTSEQFEAIIFDKIIHAQYPYDSTIVLYEESLENVVSRFRSIFWFASFRNPGPDNFGNHFGKKLARLLKAIAAVKRNMDDHIRLQALLLPIRSFQSENTQRLLTTIVNYEGYPDFSSELSQAIGGVIAKHRRPRRSRERGRERIFVDSREFAFKFGLERHGRADTADPPHNILCGLSAAYRYGIRFDDERHYNVTDYRNPTLSAEFSNCHGLNETFNSVSHVNMWPNDFCN